MLHKNSHFFYCFKAKQVFDLASVDLSLRRFDLEYLSQKLQKDVPARQGFGNQCLPAAGKRQELVFILNDQTLCPQDL